MKDKTVQMQLLVVVMSSGTRTSEQKVKSLTHDSEGNEQCQSLKN